MSDRIVFVNSRRMGGDLEELSIGELGALQQQMSNARLVIRDRKVNVLISFGTTNVIRIGILLRIVGAGRIESVGSDRRIVRSYNSVKLR